MTDNQTTTDRHPCRVGRYVLGVFGWLAFTAIFCAGLYYAHLNPEIARLWYFWVTMAFVWFITLVAI